MFKHPYAISVLFVFGAFLMLVSCSKKDDPKVTTSGGGVSSQSVVTIKGAGQ